MTKALLTVLVLRAACAQTANTTIQPIAGLKVPDIELLNQRGEKVHFYSDLVKGKLVAINTIFTTCTTICPLMGINFSKLRSELRKRVGDQGSRDVNLISITVDPDVDNPERLDKWRRQFGEDPGWTLLTGPRADVETLLKALGMFTADKQEHAPIVLIGGAEAGEWARPSTLLKPSGLAKIIQAKLELVGKH